MLDARAAADAVSHKAELLTAQLPRMLRVNRQGFIAAPAGAPGQCRRSPHPGFCPVPGETIGGPDTTGCPRGAVERLADEIEHAADRGLLVVDDVLERTGR